MSAPTWLTVKEVAALLRVAPMTVYRLVEQGDLPAIRFGVKGNGTREKRTIRIPAAALAEFLAAFWVGEIPEGYRLTDLLGEPDQQEASVTPLPGKADR